MEKMRRVLALGMVICLAVGMLAGCGKKQEKEAKTSLRIGVTLYDKYDTFVSEMMNSFSDYAKDTEELTGIKIGLDIYNAAKNQTNQDAQVKEMISNGCDVICVNLVDRTAPTNIIDMAEKADVPIVFFNRELVPEDLKRWEKLYYVGAVAEESGVLEGELAAEAFQTIEGADKNGDGVCQYVMLEGEAGHQDAIVRTESSVKAVVDAGIEVEKLGSGIANWNRSQAQAKMAQFLSDNQNNIELVLANNDDMALGAIDALKAKKLNREKWPIIVGIDGTSVGLESVKNGEMYATVYNDKEGQAKELLNLAYRLGLGKSLEDLSLLTDDLYIRLPYSKILKEDATEMLNKELEETK